MLSELFKGRILLSWIPRAGLNHKWAFNGHELNKPDSLRQWERRNMEQDEQLTERWESILPNEVSIFWDLRPGLHLHGTLQMPGVCSGWFWPIGVDRGLQPSTLQRPPLGLAVGGEVCSHPQRSIPHSACLPWAQSGLAPPSPCHNTVMSQHHIPQRGLPQSLCHLSRWRKSPGSFSCDQKLFPGNWACVFASKWHFPFLGGKKNAWHIPEVGDGSKGHICLLPSSSAPWLPF